MCAVFVSITITIIIIIIIVIIDRGRHFRICSSPLQFNCEK